MVFRPLLRAYRQRYSLSWTRVCFNACLAAVLQGLPHVPLQDVRCPTFILFAVVRTDLDREAIGHCWALSWSLLA